MSEVDIVSERWVGETAGWKALKDGRQLVESGAVQGAARAGAAYTGSVLEGKRTFRAGILVRGKTDVENLCSCRESRSTGALCPHSVAVVLTALREGQRTADRGNGERSNPEGAAGRREQHRREGAAEIAAAFPRAFTIRLTGDWERRLRDGRLCVSVEASDQSPKAADDALRAWLIRSGVERLPVALVLDGRTAPGFLESVVVQERLVAEGSGGAEVLSMAVRPPLRLEDAPGKGGEGSIAMRLVISDDCVLLGPGAEDAGWWMWLGESRAFAPLGRRLELSADEIEEIVATARSSRAAFLRSRMWVARHLAALDALFQVEASGVASLPAVRRASPSFRLAVEGSLNHLAGKLEAVYGERRVLCGRPAEGFPVPDPAAAGSFLDRDREEEERALRVLCQSGFSAPDASGQFALRGERQVLRWYASIQPRLAAAGWKITTGARFAGLTKHVDVIRPVLNVCGREGGWLDVDIGYAGGDGSALERAEVLRLLRSGRTSGSRAGQARWVVDEEACDELEEVLHDVNPEQREGRFRIPEFQEAYLTAAVAGTAAELGALPLDRGATRTAAWDQLRPYQRDGVQWLAHRAARGWGGILADEMGLGKTVQVLTFLDWLRGEKSAETLGFLIVCPTSLLANWMAEARRFAPRMAAVTYHGSARKFPGAEFDGMLLTTYGVLLQDSEVLRRQTWRCAVLDEATAIKNPDTRTARAARRIPAAVRIAMTGTPVENTVRELWSLLEFVCPGYLGSRQDFRIRYEQPLSGEAPPPAVARRFRHRIAPFVLRRTKREVARDLPDRIEQVRFCELRPAQRNLYTAILRAGREAVESGSRQGEGAVRMLMLTALLRLRQVCCDPRLVQHGDASVAPKSGISGKIDALGELLEEALEGGHRVLLFSQFVGQLRLLREWCAEMGWRHCYLDGQTAGRAAEVERFQNDASIPLFLISLKAGGYGLNLTAADTVVLYDPWWNPAVERQAADRAHRIGQGRTVTVYRLIAKGTVEEKILALQRRKSAVVDMALDDEQPVMSGLRDEDLRELLA